MPRGPSKRVLAGIALLCFSNLLLEVVLTRIFSAMMFYHFTFLAIALALLGMAGGGVHVYVRRLSLRDDSEGKALSRYARRCCWATVVALGYALAFPISFTVETTDLRFTLFKFLQVLLLTAISSLPFFFAGTALSLAITRFASSIGAVYFFDLAGAGVAALAAGVLLSALGGPGAALFAAAAAAGAGLLLARPGPSEWGTAAFSLLLLGGNLYWPVFVVPSVKTAVSDRIVFEKWNVFSRVTVERVDWGLDIKIDSYASTPLLDSDAIQRVNPRTDFAALVHTLFPEGAREVLIIGPGGGRDVVHALAARAHHVTGVDINPIIVNDIMRGRFLATTKGLYNDPRVTIAVEDGRSYLRRSPRRFDIVQASMVDTWAASASGAFALTENTLYTSEAFEDYFSRLTDGGVLSMSRWWGRESERLVVLAAQALEHLGVPSSEMRQHLYLVRRSYPEKKETFGTLLATRRGLSAAQTRRLDAASASGGFDVILSPTASGIPGFERILDASYRARLDYDLSPPSDDRPFFFYFARPLTSSTPSTPGGAHNGGLLVVAACALSIAVLAGGFLLLPMVLVHSALPKATRKPRQTGYPWLLGYFAALGVGFIVVELSLTQRLTLFLGRPAYAFVIVLASLLASSAMGALLCRGSGGRPAATACATGSIVVVLLACMILGLDPLLRSVVGLPFAARGALAGLIAAVPGLPMGMMLPLGVRFTSAAAEEIVPWCWGMNGAMSVVGTVGSTFVALNWGFGSAIVVGACSYVVAAVLAWRSISVIARSSGDRSPKRSN